MGRFLDRCPLPGLYALVIAMLMALTLWTSDTVTAMADAEGARSVFVIDPGHGGEDGGASSPSGRLESGLNLEISMRLRDLLRFLGQDVTMLRETDISIYTKGETLSQKKISDLKERVRITNNIPNAILLSIHLNSYPDSRSSGPQVFHNGDPLSCDLAQALQERLNQCLHTDRRSKRGEGIYLLEHIQCPGALIECGFLSNPEESARLETAEHQKILACIIACTAISYANT